MEQGCKTQAMALLENLRVQVLTESAMDDSLQTRVMVHIAWGILKHAEEHLAHRHAVVSYTLSELVGVYA